MGEGQTAGAAAGAAAAQAKVMIVMGSDSDLCAMRECIDTLGRFDVPYEVAVASAHRSLDRTISLARGAARRGIRVIIAAAGAAAHLAGVVAAATTLPVIGVPRSGSALAGVDALYSTVQMPPGVPVACVGIDAARNAALLAVAILALGDEALARKLVEHRERLAAETEEKQRRVLAALGEGEGSCR